MGLTLDRGGAYLATQELTLGRGPRSLVLKESSGVDLAAARWLAGVLGSTLVGANDLETERLASEDDTAALASIV